MRDRILVMPCRCPGTIKKRVNISTKLRRLSPRSPDLSQRHGSWHYARNTLDLNAIIGRWGDGNVYMACGYSGHGIMHAPATGIALSELILRGRYQTMDLSPFGYQRIEEKLAQLGARIRRLS